MSIIIACVPTINPLISLVAQRFGSRTGGYSDPLHGYQRHTEINDSNTPIALGFTVKQSSASHGAEGWVEMTSQEAKRKVKTLEDRNRNQQIQV